MSKKKKNKKSLFEAATQLMTALGMLLTGIAALIQALD